MKARGSGRTGFTLIELLVVISVIGILAGIIVAAVQNVNKTAKKAACSQLLKNIDSALGAYFADEAAFPPDRYRNWSAANAGGAAVGGAADVIATQSYVYTLMHGKSVYFNAEDKDLYDPNPGNATPVRDESGVEVKDTWWVSDNPTTNLVMYIVAPQRRNFANYFNFPGGGPGKYNLWSIGPDGKCDSCNHVPPPVGFTPAGPSQFHANGGATSNTPPSQLPSSPHIGGKIDNDDVQ